MDITKVIYGIFIYILSVCIGSFLNVVIYRLPNNMSLVSPPSHCPNCNHKITWHDNIPLISYLFLGGKCRYCKSKISFQYFFVEFLTGLLAVIVYLKYGISFRTLIGILLMYVLIPLSFIDWKYGIIPDSFNIIILIIGVFSLFFGKIDNESILIIDYKNRLEGLGIAIVLVLILIVLSRIRKKELIGGGDLKFFLGISLVFGWQLFLLSIFFASILALVVVFFSRVVLKKADDKILIPFGPFLAIAFFINYLIGIDFLVWYYSLIG